MKRRIASGARCAIERGTLALWFACGIAGTGTARADDGVTAAAGTDPAKMEEAKRHFQRGLTLLRDPEGEVVEGAYLEFKAAYELSRSPRVLGNIGYCAMRMERNSESVAAYRDYERLVPGIAPSERAQIDQDLVTMTDGSTTLTVRYAGPSAWTLVDERVPVRAAMVTNNYSGAAGQPLTLLLHAGHHVVHLKVEGEEQGRWELDATGGASFSHTFEVKRVAAAPVAGAPQSAGDRTEPSSKVPQAVTIGVGGALLVAGAITGIAAFNKMKDIEQECPGNVCPNASFHGDVSSASTLGTVTDTMLIGGGILVAGGLLWLALSPSHRASDSASSSAGGGARAARVDAPSVGGVCLPGSCALSIHGSF